MITVGAYGPLPARTLPRKIIRREHPNQGEIMSKDGRYVETKIIDHVESLNNDPYGNPAWRVTFTDGTVTRTSSGASVAWGLNNSDMIGRPLEITFTRAGRIVYAEKV